MGYAWQQLPGQVIICHIFNKHSIIDIETDLEKAAEVVQGALGPQEAPRQNGADLLAQCVEAGDEAIWNLFLKECHRNYKGTYFLGIFFESL